MLLSAALNDALNKQVGTKCSIVCNEATIGGLINPFRKEGNV